MIGAFMSKVIWIVSLGSYITLRLSLGKTANVGRAARSLNALRKWPGHPIEYRPQYALSKASCMNQIHKSVPFSCIVIL